jgi:hypothetical protein
MLTGTYSPGLDLTNTTRSVGFGGTLAGTLGNGAAQYVGVLSVTGYGTETGDLSLGTGNGTATITGTNGPPGYGATLTCALTWRRIGMWTLWTLQCTGTITTPFGSVVVTFCISWMTLLAFGGNLPWSVWAAAGFIGPWPC